jgi:predicted AlkP superfamily pyrophosphatase or phosphodiesterase
VEPEDRGELGTPALPDYGGACLCNLVPALLGHQDPPDWLPREAVDAERLVLLTLDGLGWEQFQARLHLAPTLAEMTAVPLQTVLPTTTATALTSLTTGCPPGEHGIISYRMYVQGEVLNVLRWGTGSGDARATIPPRSIQRHLPFLGQRPPICTRAEFSQTGFTLAHLDGVRFNGWRMPSTLVAELVRLAKAEPFVYGYYDGIDKVSHEYGLREHYDAELSFADRLVGDLLDSVPAGTVVVVTSDHGQVDVGENLVGLHPEVQSHVALQSGEGRFRWLHARPGRARALFEAAQGAHGDNAWVLTRDEMVEAGWFGPSVRPEAAARLGDVALVAATDVAFVEPSDTGPYHLIGRHGSATSAELMVPLLVGVR